MALLPLVDEEFMAKFATIYGKLGSHGHAEVRRLYLYNLPGVMSLLTGPYPSQAFAAYQGIMMSDCKPNRLLGCRIMHELAKCFDAASVPRKFSQLLECMLGLDDVEIALEISLGEMLRLIGGESREQRVVYWRYVERRVEGPCAAAGQGLRAEFEEVRLERGISQLNPRVPAVRARAPLREVPATAAVQGAEEQALRRAVDEDYRALLRAMQGLRDPAANKRHDDAELLQGELPEAHPLPGVGGRGGPVRESQALPGAECKRLCVCSATNA